MSTDIGILKGQHILSVVGLEAESEEVVISTVEGHKYKMEHYQDCCEFVRLYEVCGDSKDLAGLVLSAEESTSDATLGGEGDESHTWTFYNVTTEKGSVNMRWLGSSNGYYSESVDFTEIV